MMTLLELREAAALVDQRRRLIALLDSPNCDLISVGEFIDADAVAAILPAHREWLSRNLASINARLFDLGVDTDATEAEKAACRGAVIIADRDVMMVNGRVTRRTE